MEITSHLCRCCLKTKLELKNISSDKMKINSLDNDMQCVPINECFKNVLPEILLTKMTQKICNACELKLKEAYEFRQECINSNTVLSEQPESLLEIKLEIKNECDVVAPFVTEIVSPVNTERKIRKRRSTRTTASVTPLEEEVDCKKADIIIEENKFTVKSVEATFLCYYCDVELFTHDEFLVHRETHRAPGENFAIKRICNLCLSEVNDYVKHVQDQHVDYKPNVCRTCNKSFVIQNELKNHLGTHASPKKVRCQSCSVEFQTVKALQRHLLLKPNTHYYCPFCGVAFSTIESVDFHVQENHPSYRNKLMLPCYKCKQIFLSFVKLDRHVCKDLPAQSRATPKSGAGKLTCNDCGEDFEQKEHIVCHKMVCSNRRDGNMYICHLCQKQFHNKTKLSKHKSSAHREKSYQCDQCGFQTKTKSSLRLHSLKHTDARPFQCNHPGCLSRFKDKHHLNSHQWSHNDNMYECDLCEKRFKAYIHIKTHMAQHLSDFKKFSCEICSKMYTTKYNLDAHRAAHMGKRTFTCDQCPNTYLRQNALNVHKKSAHLKIRYQCKFCDKWFGQDKSLVEHLFSHRGYKPWNCPVCRQGYLRKDKFIKHLKTHNVQYNEKIHGFKETYRSVLMSGLKVVAQTNCEANTLEPQ